MTLNPGYRWRCMHARSSPLLGTEFAGLSRWPGFALAAALEVGGAFPSKLIVLELQQRQQLCPGCRTMDRRARRHWAALGFAIGVAIVALWRCAHG